MVKTWMRQYPCDDIVRDLVDSQKDRDFCRFQFTNNLECGSTIAYLKIGHVLLGRDTFVYEECDLTQSGMFIIPRYAIGVDTDEKIKNIQDTEDLIVSTTNKVDKGTKRDMNNVYDRIYIHMVIKDANGRLHPFHHCYDTNMEKELNDLITIKNDRKDSSKVVSRKFINMSTINLFFDPDFDNVLNGRGLKLTFNVITPAGTSIDLCKTALRP